MPRRLGEKLIQDGVLDRRQVDEALQTQLMSGGTIGTCLLDLGYVDEETLTAALAEEFRVAAAPLSKMRKIDEETAALLTPEQAARHLAIPVERDGNKLLVAGVAPKRLVTLGRITGLEVEVSVAPEVRILEALETFYGIKMSPRFVRIAKDLERQRKGKRKPAMTKSAEMPVPHVDLASIDNSKEFGYGRDWRCIAAELGEELDPVESVADAVDPPEFVPERRSRLDRRKKTPQTLDGVFDAICAANYKEEIFEALLDYSSQRMDRCMIFGIRSQLAHVWDYRGKELDKERVAALRIPVGGGSIFGNLLGRPAYRGAVDGDGGSRQFFKLLQVDPPKEAILRPVYLMDRLVAILYGDRGKKKLKDDDERTFEVLAERLSMAFSLLILKNKIRATPAPVDSSESS